MNLKPQKIILLFIPAIVLTLGLSICFQSLLAAWTAPLANPATCLTGNPGCDAPISSGSPLVQQMQGALWIVDSAYPASLNGLIVEKGNVGIGTTGPNYMLDVVKSTGATIGVGSTNTALGQDELVGALAFTTDDASNRDSEVFAKIDAISADAGGWSSSLRFFTSYNSAQTTLAERMRIDNSGNVGIGTTSPGTARLAVYSVSGIAKQTIIAADGTNDSWLNFETNDTEWSIGMDKSDSNKFKIAIADTLGTASDKLTIQTDGNVGIGTTNPTQKLHVAGNLNVTGTAYANGQALCQANGTNCPAASTNADTVDGLHAGSFRQFNAWQNNHYSGSDGAEYAT
ncbi:MAG: hypothetical protein V1667_02290, partial [bacterium]